MRSATTRVESPTQKKDYEQALSQSHEWACVVAYDGPEGDQGDIKCVGTYKKCERIANASSWLGIVAVRDMLSY